jgi:membrane protease YdiL (CAAX protease family)
MAAEPEIETSLDGRAGYGIGARATWGLKDVGLVAALAVSTLLLYSILLFSPVDAHFGKDSGEANLALALVSIVWDLTLVGLVFWRVRHAGGDGASLGLRGPRLVVDTPFKMIGWRGPWTIAKLGAWGALTYFASNITVQIYVRIIDATGIDGLLPDKQLPEEAFNHWWVIVPLGFAVVFMAPFAEELAFRGFTYAGFRRRTTIVLAALASGLLFSLAHGQPGLILPFCFVGAYFAYTYEQTGTLYASMSVHFIFNAISFLILVLVPDARTG